MSGPVEDLKPLTSLRFVAAMMIVLLPSSLYFKQWHWLSYVPGTTAHGVSFFFVLSGFILTHVYRTRKFTYGSFIRARIARLWPVHLVTLAMVMFLVRPDSVTFDGPGIFSKWITLAANMTLTQSIVPFFAYTFSWNSVSWSISTEIFFYLAFPVLLLSLQTTWHWKLALSLIVAAGLVLVAKALSLPDGGDVFELTTSSLLYASPLARGFEFCLGMAAYLAWVRLSKVPLSTRQATVVEALAVLAAALWLTLGYSALFPEFLVFYGSAGSCWIFAIVIIALASGRGYIGKAISAPLVVWLGDISFALYMVHVILMKIISLGNPIYGLLPNPNPSPLLVYGACIAGAAILHHVIEKPFRRKLIVGLWRVPTGRYS
jgi:peptidoglycan/LPS O-acetylase OafA/YrhL